MANEMLPASRQAQNGELAALPDIDENGEAGAGGKLGAASLAASISRHRKVLLFAAAGLMLAAFISMVLWSAKPPYQTLYAGMDAKSAASVVSYLQKQHIPYKLQGEGTVTVPADQVYSTRLKLAGQDIAPGGDSGFELFDKKSDFGISDFAQQVNYQRALQGELERTIEVLPMIDVARVQIVLAKDSAFADRKRKATASVMLKLSGSEKLSHQNVTAIQNLVASSVASLDPKEVTVVDSSGNLLSRDDGNSALSGGQSLQERQARIEQRLEARITGMLDQVVGQGQAVVRVTAVLNRQMSELNSKSYNPDEQVVRSQTEASESRMSDTAAATGVPGTASNTPGANPATANTGNNAPKDNASRKQSTINYEISSTTEHKVIPSGGIDKISVAAIVGGTFAKPGDPSTFQPRSKAQLKTLQGLIERAIGYDEDRGDTVDIQSLPLIDVNNDHAKASLNAQANKSFYLQLARYGLAGLAMLLLAFFIVRPLARLVGGEGKRKAGEAQPGGSAIPALLSPNYAHLENMEQTRFAIQHQPERAGKILREWVEQV